MPRFLDTRGHTTLAIGICARCKVKYCLDELRPDPNAPGLLCCPDGCLDELDPYRLPARETERVDVDNPRPDAPLTGTRPTPLFGQEQIDPIFAGLHLASPPVAALGPTRPWQPRTFYNVGDTVTVQNVDDQNVDLPQRWFVCLQSGLSGDTPPPWPDLTGIRVR